VPSITVALRITRSMRAIVGFKPEEVP
jgi:hypothetical protein